MLRKVLECGVVNNLKPAWFLTCVSKLAIAKPGVDRFVVVHKPVAISRDGVLWEPFILAPLIQQASADAVPRGDLH
jgi:hypothetical protein